MIIWVLRCLTRLWFKWYGFKQAVRPLFEEALEHSRTVHGDTRVHHDCEKCLNLAEGMMKVYGQSPEYLANGTYEGSGIAASVAASIVDRKKSKWTTH